jgi:hypothetical protein
MKKSAKLEKCKDYESMPRRVRSQRCCALEFDGNRCQRFGNIQVYCHLDPESNFTGVHWVCVVLCDAHAGEKNLTNS